MSRYDNPAEDRKAMEQGAEQTSPDTKPVSQGLEGKIAEMQAEVDALEAQLNPIPGMSSEEFAAAKANERLKKGVEVSDEEVDKLFEGVIEK